jgi:hypothetical protein
MNQEIFDPYEAQRYMGFRRQRLVRVPETVTDPDAIALWNSVMSAVYSYNEKVLPVPITASRSLGDAVQKIMTDEAHVMAKFGRPKLTAKEVYEAIHMSRATWGRIMRGEMSDVERGNVFALALGLKLNTEQTQELLYSAGFALNFSLELDAAIMYFIKNEIYDIEYIYGILSQFSDIKNGLDCFRFRT